MSALLAALCVPMIILIIVSGDTPSHRAFLPSLDHSLFDSPSSTPRKAHATENFSRERLRGRYLLVECTANLKYSTTWQAFVAFFLFLYDSC